MIEFIQPQPENRQPEPATLRFPAGEPHIVGGPPDALSGDQIAYVRGADADDLVTLLMWARAVRTDGGRPHALIPYLPGARADREPRLEAAVYAELINTGRFETVTCADPHSPVMPDLISRLQTVTAAELIDRFLPCPLRDGLTAVIAPDAGAACRAGQVAERLDVPLVQAHKHRDFQTGTLSGFSCDPLPADGDLLVVDDICDGGGTFMGLAAAVPEATGRLHLWVTHGVFSGNAAQLLDAYRTVMSTDSHPGCRNIPGSVVYPPLHAPTDHPPLDTRSLTR